MALDRTRILQAALTLLTRDGLEGLTMRRLAAELDVKAASLYWHYRNKQALVDDMAGTILSEVNAAPRAHSHRDLVHSIAADLRQKLLKHRDGALLLQGRMHLQPEGLRIAEAMIDGLVKAGFGAEPSGRAALALLSFVQGHVMGEQSGQAGSHHFPGVLQNLSLTTAARFPQATAALADFVETPADQRFAFGIDLIVEGLGPGRHDAAVDRMVAAFRSIR